MPKTKRGRPSKNKAIEKERKPKKKTAYQPKHWHVFHQVWTIDEMNQLADELLDWFEESTETGKERLWFKDFLAEKRISNQRISEFTEKNKYFAYVLDIVKQRQESKLVKIGMNPNVKGTMPVFALKNVAGWRDVRDIDLTVVDKEKALKDLIDQFE